MYHGRLARVIWRKTGARRPCHEKHAPLLLSVVLMRLFAASRFTRFLGAASPQILLQKLHRQRPRFLRRFQVRTFALILPAEESMPRAVEGVRRVLLAQLLHLLLGG